MSGSGQGGWPPPSGGGGGAGWPPPASPPPASPPPPAAGGGAAWPPPAGAPPPPGGGYAPPPQQAGASGKAVTALVLSIVSWVFCGFIASIPAIFIAKSELSAIERGESSPAGKGMAQAAFWIAIINTVCTCLGTIAYIIFFVVMAQQGGAFRTF